MRCPGLVNEICPDDPTSNQLAGGALRGSATVRAVRVGLDDGDRLDAAGLHLLETEVTVPETEVTALDVRTLLRAVGAAG